MAQLSDNKNATETLPNLQNIRPEKENIKSIQKQRKLRKHYT